MGDYNISTKSISPYWIYLLLAVILFKPTPTVILGPTVGMKIPDLIYVSVFLIFISLHNKFIKFNKLFLIVSLLMFIEALSLLIGVFKHEIIINDMVELFRPIVYILAFLTGTILSNINFKNGYNERIIDLLLVLFIIFSILIFFNIYGIKEIIGNIYELGKSRGVADHNISNIFRLSSTFTNPNYFGMFSTILSGFFFYKTLQDLKLKYLFYFFIFLFFIFISGSRTSLFSFFLLSIILIIIDLLIIRKFYIKKNIVYITLLFVLILFIPTFIDLVLDKLWRFANIENMQESFGARLNMWNIALNSIYENILFGVGSNKSEIESLDNNYLIILYKQGLFGLLILFSIFIYSIIISLKLLIKKSNIFQELGVLSICFIIVFLIGMISAVPFYMSHLSIPFILLLGVLSNHRRIKYD